MSTSSVPAYARVVPNPILYAVTANADAIQNYVNNGLMKLSQMIAASLERVSTAWLLKMDNPNDPKPTDSFNPDTNPEAFSMLTIINWDSSHDDDYHKAKIQADTTKYQTLQTAQSKDTGFLQGMLTPMNDTLSHTNDQASFDYTVCSYVFQWLQTASAGI